MIISFVVILKIKFDCHVLFHALQGKNRSYFPEKNLVYIYKHPQKFVQVKNLRLGHPRRFVHAKWKKFSPRKYIHAKIYLPKVVVTHKFTLPTMIKQWSTNLLQIILQQLVLNFVDGGGIKIRTCMPQSRTPNFPDVELFTRWRWRSYLSLETLLSPTGLVPIFKSIAHGHLKSLDMFSRSINAVSIT